MQNNKTAKKTQTYLICLVFLFSLISILALNLKDFDDRQMIKDELESLKEEKVFSYQNIDSVLAIFGEIENDKSSTLDLSANNIELFNILEYLSEDRKLGIKELDLSANKIEDISFLKSFTNLEKLDLSQNKIEDISVILNLKNLEELNLEGNQIEDISSLKYLRKLNNLDLSNNLIEDISKLENLTALKFFDISRNQIKNIEIIKNFENLEIVYLNNNLISRFEKVEKLDNIRELYISDNLAKQIDLKNFLNLENFYSDNKIAKNYECLEHLKYSNLDISNAIEEAKVKFNLISDYMVLGEYQNNIYAAKVCDQRILAVSDNQGESFEEIYKFQDNIEGIHIVEKEEDAKILLSTSLGRYEKYAKTKLFRADIEDKYIFEKVLDIKTGSAINWNITSDDKGRVFVSEYGYKEDELDNSRRIYMSLNYAKDWDIIYKPDAEFDYHNHKIFISKHEKDTIYQSIGDWRHHGILKSVDNGENFEKIISGIHPTSAVEFENHILWGLDTYPKSGIAYHSKINNSVRIIEMPEPFNGSSYDLVEKNGVVYALFLSYSGKINFWPASIFYSKDEGRTWEKLLHINKYLDTGLGLYNIICTDDYAFVNIGFNKIAGKKAIPFRGSLRFKLL